MGCCASKSTFAGTEEIEVTEQLNRTATTYATLIGADELSDFSVVDGNGQALYNWEPLGEKESKQTVLKDYIAVIGAFSPAGYFIIDTSAVCIHSMTAGSGAQLYIVLSLRCSDNSKLRNLNPLKSSQETSHLIDQLREIILKCKLTRKGSLPISTKASTKSEKGW